MVINYEPKYYEDVVELVHGFYKKYLQSYYTELDPQKIIETVTHHGGQEPENAFLAIKDDRCVGLLSGIQINNRLSYDKIFQEIFWYTEPGHGKTGFNLVKETEKMLKERGFSSIIMSVVESHKSERIKQIYQDMGYTPMETHYMRAL
jgi:hypothetical protein